MAKKNSLPYILCLAFLLATGACSAMFRIVSKKILLTAAEKLYNHHRKTKSTDRTPITKKTEPIIDFYSGNAIKEQPPVENYGGYYKKID
ncbi:hypothetical protein KKA53_01905 [Candidatus Dependentiae bacterium]|nr:hypothetical protein [Candidatus Dependentiae bacterium]